MFLFLNDFGVDITLTVIDQDCAPVSLVSSTVRQFELVKPDGTVVTKTAVFVTDGSDGQLKYTVETGVLDVLGTWGVRAKITEGASKVYRTEIINFAVKA